MRPLASYKSNTRFKWNPADSNWKPRTNRSNNFTFYSNKPRQHYLLPGITVPGGDSGGGRENVV
jgi:hypothetical protein